MSEPEELPFGLEWLLSVAKKPQSVSVCPEGHLRVAGRTCWQPVRLSADLHAVWFRWVEHEEAQ